MRPCVVKGRKAFFHCWEHKAWVVEPGISIGSHPAIQADRPLLCSAYPYEITFTDKELKQNDR